MSKHSSPTVKLTQSRAAFKIRQLLDELQMLLGTFPSLRDAFDADELPLAFILQRDSQRAESAATPRRRFSPGALMPVTRQTTASATAPLGRSVTTHQRDSRSRLVPRGDRQTNG